jgi:hypothetical protein
MDATDEPPGVSEGDRSRQQANESTEPLVGRLGAAVEHTAKAARISRYAVKSCCACEWGAWGRVSVDGLGHYNPDRSEDPWGRAANAARTVVHRRTAYPGSEPGYYVTGSEVHEGRMPTARLTRSRQEGPSDIPALKPYWGKPAVRNFRGDHGDVGIIREQPTRLRVLRGESPRSANCL